MMALQNVRRTGTAVVLSGVAVVAAACVPAAHPDLTARYGDGATAPMTLACEPNQRAIVRQMIVNGVAQAQLECSTAAGTSVYGTTAPASYATAVPASYGYTPAALTDTQLVRTAYEPAVISRAVTPQRGVSQRAASSSTVHHVAAAHVARSGAKSAVIIGSSACVGA